ncbi:hypothetical protein DPMN_116601 [Dreissena polymorpha]|uniref:Uncharacterized protein n=2 Tax=Dreissena polymorpha TaxID=45954 RepID=A0A9D4KP90_DREPO|nr:hypothetical protein DPMN_116601 [Dreissena polymorpha]
MTSMRSDKSKYTFDGSHRNDAVKDFPALERATTSIAPVNHQHHVLEKGGMLATSPAPSAFKKPTKQNFSETPREADIETHRSGDSIISFRRTKTSMTDKSVNSINSVEIIEPPRTPNPNRLVPIDDKKSLVGRIPNKSPKLNGKVPYLDLNGHHTPVRSNTPVNHGMRVSDSDRSSRSVSTVDN